MTDKLDLSPIIEAYQWLKDNPEHFNMRHFISKPDEEENTFRMADTSLVTPDCGTTFCLGGTILLLQARKEGKTCLDISEGGPVTMKVFKLLKKNNPNWTGWKSKLSNNLSDMLDELFMGDWHEEHMNISLDNITLPQLWEGIEYLCKAFEFKPSKQ